jgi:hypothetical protein
MTDLWSNALRVQSLVEGFKRVLAKHGNALWEPDALQGAIATIGVPSDREWWSVSHRANDLNGLVRYEKAPIYAHALSDAAHLGKKSPLQKACEEARILVWSCQNTFKFDGKFGIRLVDTNWLTKPEEILAHVTAQPDTGMRCRFCSIIEWPDAGNVAGVRKLDPHDLGSASVHVECAPYWFKWVDVAASATKPRQSKTTAKALTSNVR